MRTVVIFIIRNKMRHSVMIWVVFLLYVVDASIEVIDSLGRTVTTFPDRKATANDGILEGYIESAVPPDACTGIAAPTLQYKTNCTMQKIVLINGTGECNFTTKVRNAEAVGYDIAVLFDPSPLPFIYPNLSFPLPQGEINLTVVLILFDDGIVIRNNYLYNKSSEQNFLIRITQDPNPTILNSYTVIFFMIAVFLAFLVIKILKWVVRRIKGLISQRPPDDLARLSRLFPIVRYWKGDPYERCVICLNDFKWRDRLRVLKCRHAFHVRCIDNWLLGERRRCPMCKRKVLLGDAGDALDPDSSESTPLLSGASPRRLYTSTDGSGPSNIPDSSSEDPLLQSSESDELYATPQGSVNPCIDVDLATD